MTQNSVHRLIQRLKPKNIRSNQWNKILIGPSIFFEGHKQGINRL